MHTESSVSESLMLTGFADTSTVQLEQSWTGERQNAHLCCDRTKASVRSLYPRLSLYSASVCSGCLSALFAFLFAVSLCPFGTLCRRLHSQPLSAVFCIWHSFPSSSRHCLADVVLQTRWSRVSPSCVLRRLQKSPLPLEPGFTSSNSKLILQVSGVNVPKAVL